MPTDQTCQLWQNLRNGADCSGRKVSPAAARLIKQTAEITDSRAHGPESVKRRQQLTGCRLAELCHILAHTGKLLLKVDFDVGFDLYRIKLNGTELFGNVSHTQRQLGIEVHFINLFLQPVNLDGKLLTGFGVKLDVKLGS